MCPGFLRSHQKVGRAFATTTARSALPARGRGIRPAVAKLTFAKLESSDCQACWCRLENPVVLSAVRQYAALGPQGCAAARFSGPHRPATPSGGLDRPEAKNRKYGDARHSAGFQPDLIISEVALA